MTKQGYINWRRGVAAYKNGKPFSLSMDHSWKMGWLQQSHIQADIEAANAINQKPVNAIRSTLHVPRTQQL